MPTASGLFVEAGHLIVDLARRYYEQDDAERAAAQHRELQGVRERHERSTSPWAARPTPCCISWPPPMRARSTSPWTTSTGCRAGCRCCARSRPSVADVHMEDVHRAGGIMAILGELDRAGLHHTRPADACMRRRWATALERWDITPHPERERARFLPRGARRRADAGRLQPGPPLGRARSRPRERRASATPSTPSPGTAASPCSTATSPLDGCIVKTAGVDASILNFAGPARVFESQDAAVEAILDQQDQGRRRRRDPLRGAARRPGHAGDALSDQLPEIEGPRQSLRADHRRPLLRRHVGPVDRPCLAGSGRRRR